MSTPPQFMYPPILSTTIDDHERRIRILEMGDPYSIAARMAAIPATIIYQTSTPFEATFLNDSAMNQDIAIIGSNLESYSVLVNNYIIDFGYWLIHQHENVFHPPQPPAGTPPTAPPMINAPNPNELYDPRDYYGVEPGRRLR